MYVENISITKIFRTQPCPTKAIAGSCSTVLKYTGVTEIVTWWPCSAQGCCSGDKKLGPTGIQPDTCYCHRHPCAQRVITMDSQLIKSEPVMTPRYQEIILRQCSHQLPNFLVLLRHIILQCTFRKTLKRKTKRQPLPMCYTSLPYFDSNNFTWYSNKESKIYN